MGKGNFNLEKWYMDFIGEDGVAMIFYAAKLQWKGFTIPYASYLSWHPDSEQKQRSGFRSVQMPKRDKDRISWNDQKYQVAGEWRQTAKPISAILMDSDAGSLHWNCHQPSSSVHLTFKDQDLQGTGYAEQLILTALPWKIPMQELRWGRAHINGKSLVWIEMNGDDPKQWVWMEGNQCPSCTIRDDRLYCPELNMEVKLQQMAVLESGKTIGHMMESLAKYLPGFEEGAALSFLMAESTKWLSLARLNGPDSIGKGTAIHEYVNLNTVK